MIDKLDDVKMWSIILYIDNVKIARTYVIEEEEL